MEAGAGKGGAGVGAHADGHPSTCSSRSISGCGTCLNTMVSATSCAVTSTRARRTCGVEEVLVRTCGVEQVLV